MEFKWCDFHQLSRSCHPPSPGNTMKWTWVAWRRASPSRSLPVVRWFPRINVRSFRSGSWLTTPCPGSVGWRWLGRPAGGNVWGKNNYGNRQFEKSRCSGWRMMNINFLARVGRFWEGGNNMKEVGVDSGFIGGFRVIWLSFPWFAFESSVCVGWRAMLDHAEVIAYEFWGVLTHVCFAKWCETLQALMSDFMINYVSWHLRLMTRLLSLSSLSQQ